MTDNTYHIYHHDTLIGTINKYLNYKEKITLNDKDYIVSEFIKKSKDTTQPSIVQVITVDRFDCKGNQLFVGDIVEAEDYFYRIGSLCPEFDKEYVTYLNLDGTESETNYASFCTKLTYEHYEELKSDYLTFLNRLEKVYKLVQVETWRKEKA